MAITIRTGSNGSYKTAYTVWFVILKALKEGRTVVTNIAGMEPLDVISERLDYEFPKSSKLIRIYASDDDGVDLWRHWFCWMPINAQIVIDECQDIYSKNSGFRIEKSVFRPFSDFADKLPQGFESLYNSKLMTVSPDEFSSSDMDDRGKARFDETGKIIYPLNFQEAFMKHRHYNWDIELLSPSYSFVETAFKDAAEECFFHKNNDSFFWAKRRPYIFKHDKTTSRPKIPEKKDPNLSKQKIPLDVHLLYKSTTTGLATKSGGTNLLFKDPKFWGAMFLILISVGYFLYGLADIFTRDSSSDDVEKIKNTSSISQPIEANVSKGSEGSGLLRDSGRSSEVDNKSSGLTNFVNESVSYLGLEGVKQLYVTGVVNEYRTRNGNRYLVNSNIILKALMVNGDQFTLRNEYLDYLAINYRVVGECMVELSRGGFKSLVVCPDPSYNHQDDSLEQSPDRTEVKLL